MLTWLKYSFNYIACYDVEQSYIVYAQVLPVLWKQTNEMTKKVKGSTYDL